MADGGGGSNIILVLSITYSGNIVNTSGLVIMSFEITSDQVVLESTIVGVPTPFCESLPMAAITCGVISPSNTVLAESTFKKLRTSANTLLVMFTVSPPFNLP